MIFKLIFLLLLHGVFFNTYASSVNVFSGRIKAEIALAETVSQIADLIKTPLLEGVPKKEASIFESVNDRLVLNMENRPLYYGAYGLEQNAQKSQMWKLHVSAAFGKEVAVLKKVLPYLLEQSIYFKIVKDEDRYKEMSPLQQGKLITIYPTSPEKSVKYAEDIDKLLGEDFEPKDFLPPPNETVYGQSGGVSYRFGCYDSPKNLPDILIQKALRQPYYLTALDNRNAQGVPFVPNPFPQKQQEPWHKTVDDLLGKDLFHDVAFGLATGQGLGGIRSSPIQPHEYDLFFPKLINVVRNFIYSDNFTENFLHPFIFTQKIKEQDFTHSLVVTLLATAIRDKHFKHIVPYEDVIKVLKGRQYRCIQDDQYNHLGYKLHGKTIPTLFEENVELGSFDHFLERNNIQKTFNFFWGITQEYLERPE